MSESEILDRIEALVAVEMEALATGRRRAFGGAPTPGIAEARAERGQLWDLMRRRRAEVAAGGDPDRLRLRPRAMTDAYDSASPAIRTPRQSRSAHRRVQVWA